MKKTILIIMAICLVLLFGIIASNVLYLIKNNDKEDVIIMQKETALKIGRAVLEEYSETYWKRPFEECLDAIEKDDIWIVYNVLERQDTATDGKKNVLLGGGIYVEIRKNNGEILKIAVED